MVKYLIHTSIQNDVEDGLRDILQDNVKNKRFYSPSVLLLILLNHKSKHSVLFIIRHTLLATSGQVKLH